MSLVPLPWWTSQSSTSTRRDVEPVERIPGRNGHVVEQAEAHRPRRLGMVPGWAQTAERDLRFPRNQRGDGAHARRRPRAAPPRTNARTPPCPCRASRPRARSPPRSGPRTPRGAPPPAPPGRPPVRAAARARATRARRAPARSPGSGPRARGGRPCRARARRDGAGRGRGSWCRSGRGRRPRRIPYRPVIPPPLIEAADVAVVGAGAAGLYTALIAAGRRRARRARVELAAGAVGELLGAGWAGGGAGPRRQRGAPPGRHGRRGARRHRPAHGRDPLRRGAGAGARAGAARDLVRPLAGRRAAAVPRGRSHAPPRRPRRRQRDRQARDGAAVRAGDRRGRGSRCTSAHPPGALWVEDGRCVGVVTESAAIPAAATVLATGGAAALWQRTTNPRGAIGSGLTLAARRRGRARRPGVHAVPPDRRRGARRPRRLPRHRGCSRRRRAAGERRGRAFRGRARTAGRGHARHAEPHECGTAARSSTCARSTCARSRTSSSAWLRPASIRSGTSCRSPPRRTT